MQNLLRQLIKELILEHLNEVVHLHVPETEKEKQAFMNLMMQLSKKLPDGAEDVAKEALESENWEAALDIIKDYLALKRIPFAIEPTPKIGPLKM